MASVFGHAAAGAAIVAASSRHIPRLPGRFWLLAVTLSTLPDADVISFRFGIPYGSVWGHRGLSHSLPFSTVLAGITSWALSRWEKEHYISRLWAARVLLLAILSHPLLDSMTTGGRGVAVFAPFSKKRTFARFRPILVSPIGVRAFFNAYGLQVIRSEAIWIGIPCLLMVISSRFRRKDGASARPTRELTRII